MYQELKSYYEKNALQWLNEGRALFYQPIDHTGWGNKIRGLVGSFLFCLLTRRFFFMADEFLHYFIQSPFKFSWLPQDYPQSRELAKTAFLFIPPFRPDNWSDEFWNILCHQKIDDVPTTNPVIWYAESTSPHNALLINSNYKNFFELLGLNTTNKMQVIAQLTTLLLFKFRKIWLTKKSDVCVQQKIRFDDSNHRFIGVQYRSFIDVKEYSSQKRNEQFVEFLNKVLQKLTEFIKNNERPNIFVSSDYSEFTIKLKHSLEKMGAVYSSNLEVILTGGTYSEKKPNLFQKIVTKITNKIKDYFPHSPKLNFRKLPISDHFAEKKVRKKAFPIIDWLILGECDVIISPFTSYAIFAAARTGNRAQLYKIDPYNQIFSEMNDETYLF